jgi:hypothetical protein
MSDMQTVVQTEIKINDTPSLLAQDQDVADLKRRIEAAMATTGRFVEFVVVGNRRVSVLISPFTQVVVSVATVHFDPRDTGDESAPYGGWLDSI